MNLRMQYIDTEFVNWEMMLYTAVILQLFFSQQSVCLDSTGMILTAPDRAAEWPKAFSLS